MCGVKGSLRGGSWGKEMGREQEQQDKERQHAETERAGHDRRHAPRPRVMRGKSEWWGGGVNPDSFFFLLSNANS